MESQLFSVILLLLSLSALCFQLTEHFPCRGSIVFYPCSLTQCLSEWMKDFLMESQFTPVSSAFPGCLHSPYKMVRRRLFEPYLSGLIRVLNHPRELRSTSGPPVPALTSSPKSRLISRHKNHIKFLRLDSKVHYKWWWCLDINYIIRKGAQALGLTYWGFETWGYFGSHWLLNKDLTFYRESWPQRHILRGSGGVWCIWNFTFLKYWHVPLSSPWRKSQGL